MDHVKNDDLYSLEADLKQKATRELEDGDIKDPIKKLRLHCFRRGNTGLLDLGKSFRNMEHDGVKSLKAEEFTKAVKKSGIKVSDAELMEVFNNFNDGNGYVNTTELLEKLRPPMPQSRLKIVDQAFSKMDKTGNGVITLADLKRNYSTKHNKNYETGKQTKNEILDEFLKNFTEAPGNLENPVTKEEFLDYYATISATVDNDMCFDLLMRHAYAL